MLNNFKLHWEVVDKAYQNRNVPEIISNGVRERRQIEIQNINNLIYKQLKERYEALKSKKNSYVFSEFNKKNYNIMKDYNIKTEKLLLNDIDNKLYKQKKQIEDINLNLNKVIKESQTNQSNEIEYIQINVRIFFIFLDGAR